MTSLESFVAAIRPEPLSRIALWLTISQQYLKTLCLRPGPPSLRLAREGEMYRWDETAYGVDRPREKARENSCSCLLPLPCPRPALAQAFAQDRDGVDLHRAQQIPIDAAWSGVHRTRGDYFIGGDDKIN